MLQSVTKWVKTLRPKLGFLCFTNFFLPLPLHAMLCRCSNYLKKTANTPTLNGGDRGGVQVLLFSKGTLFEYNVSTIFFADCSYSLPEWQTVRLTFFTPREQCYQVRGSKFSHSLWKLVQTNSKRVKISVCNTLRNKWLHAKGFPKRYYLNGNIIGFPP